MGRIILALTLALVAQTSSQSKDPKSQPALRLVSPSGAVSFELSTESARLMYAVSLGRDRIVEPTPLGIIVDRKNLAEGVKVGLVASYAIDETYPWYGVHTTAVNRCHGARIAIAAMGSGRQDRDRTPAAWTLDARACDDGVA